MAAETSWHRYCAKLRHCLPMYRVWVRSEGRMMCVIVVFRGEVAGGQRSGWFKRHILDGCTHIVRARRLTYTEEGTTDWIQQ